ncbi:ParB N-terminal domain-containing protein [Mycobacterium colombiense]
MAADDPSFAYLPLSQLRFDEKNPRFPTSLDGREIDAVLRFMLQDAGLIDLMRSIAKQGFFPGEPLLVSPDSSDDQAWVVVEGNRRLAACILLVNPTLAPTRKQVVVDIADEADKPRLESVPCLRFASRPDILRHLGYRHVTGIKEWDPLAKARFLEEQFWLESGPVEERLKSVARSIGSRADYIGRLLTAFHLYQKLEENAYFDIANLSETSINFSLIPSVLAYENIVTYLGLNGSRDLEMDTLDLSRWEFISRFIFERDRNGETRLGESRNIRLLATVLADGRACEALEGGMRLAQAVQLLGGSASAFRALISEAEQNLNLARLEMEGVRFGQNDIEALDRISNSTTSLRAQVQARIAGSE